MVAAGKPDHSNRRAGILHGIRAARAAGTEIHPSGIAPDAIRILPFTVLREIDGSATRSSSLACRLKPRIEDYLNVTTLDYRTELGRISDLAAGPRRRTIDFS